MMDAGLGLPGGADRRLRWIVGSAEDAQLSAPYGLITAGASLHWLDPDVAMPRLRDALAPGAVMAVADVEIVHGPYRADVTSIIREHSELDHHTETPELMDELHAAGRFTIQGRLRTDPVPFEQSIDDYLLALHSTSTLAHVRLGDRSARFDDAVRAVFARHGLDRVRYDVIGLLAWGRPT